MCDLNNKFTEKIIQKFDSGIDQHNLIIGKIREYSSQGYILIGYKGTSKKTAASYVAKGVSVNYEAGSLSGQHKGDGCYITPSFNSALDYAKATVRKEKAYVQQSPDESLQTPSNSPPFSREKVRAMDKFDENCRFFSESQECKNKISILLFFVQDFWLMNGYVGAPQEAPRGYNPDSHHYWDDNKDESEIMFTKTEEVYNNIKVEELIDILGTNLDLGVDFLPNLYEDNIRSFVENESPIPQASQP